MTNIVYIATSLDGYIAAEDGGLDWLQEAPNPEGSDFGFGAFMDRIDALVMGRNTYETVLTFGDWPYSKPVFVVSSTLRDVPAHLADRVEIVKGEPQNLVAQLADRGFKSLYIDGGVTIQRFLAADLIDELIITRVPILLGGGYPLFDRLAQPLRFRHVETEVLNDTLVKSRYVRMR
jgi:dihydrofolate reductase